MKEKRDHHELEDTYIIKDLDALKVLADPVRNQILELVEHKSHTVKEVAEKLGLAPSKLYYHFNMLEKFNFIKVVETRQVANLIEKYFQATFRFLSVDPDLFNFSTQEGKENLQSLVEANIDTTREDLIRSFQARTFQLESGAEEKPRSIVISRNLANLSDEKFEELHHKMEDLIREFIDEDTKNPDDQTFAMMVAFYPSFYYRDFKKK